MRLRAGRASRILALSCGLASLACTSSPDPSFPTGDVSIVLNAAAAGGAAFAPNPFRRSFATGPKVTWVNADRLSNWYGGTTGTTHQLVSDAGVFDSGSLAPGKTFAFTFAASGTYSYHCAIHPSMVGTITLTP